jgi:hypothetical protein
LIDSAPESLSSRALQHPPTAMTKLKTPAEPNYRRLDPARIVDTIQLLHRRVDYRFPGSGLGKVVGELLAVSKETVERTRWIQKPNLPLRFAVAALCLLILGVLAGLLFQIRQFRFDDFVNSVQALDSSIGSTVFVGAGILFLISWENRIKRQRALSALHELRALAHIIDMHQLTKDPESHFRGASGIMQKPRMSPFELNRYLDYCSEAQSLISKIAALYVQGFPDPILLDAVDDVEDLTAGFARKIGQKLTILESLSRSFHSDPPGPIQDP